MFSFNSYSKVCEISIVKSFKDLKEKIKICDIGDKLYLGDTLFYAKNGGQPRDKGILLNSSSEIKVLDTVKDEAGEIVHVCEDIRDLKVGNKIEGIIDWTTRYKHM